MRKSLLLIFISVSLRLFSQTSVYHPFPDSNAVWNVWFSANCFANGMTNDRYSIIFSGDTVINGYTYHKLSTPYVLSNSWGTCLGVSAGYKGAIRQEIANRQVFFVPPSSSTEQLLYDFTLQVGDTVKGYLAPNFGYDVVAKIDSILIDSSYRKRWLINPCVNFDLIEGVGWMYGLIQRSPGCLIDETSFLTECVRQNGKSLYPDTISNCGTLLTSIQHAVDNNSSFSISPNPSKDIVNLSASEKFQYSVYDMFGAEIIRSDNEDETAQLDLSAFPPGIYFVRGRTGEGTFARKIVVQ